jgi:hypothetical protein
MKQNKEGSGCTPAVVAGAAPRETLHGDMLSQQGALRLARRLEAYWHERGYRAARFWTEPVIERFAKVGSYEIYRVVCNFVNGLPPRYLRD